MLHSRWINGNLAYWDTHQCRIIDAVGASVVSYINHFVSLPVDDGTAQPVDWVIFTDHDPGMSLPASNPGGVLKVDCGNTDNDEANCQLGTATNEPWVITTSNLKPLYFGIRVKAAEHADEGIFVGLMEPGKTADTLTDDSGVLIDADLIGFNILTATPAAWNATWKKAGQAVQAITGVAVNADDYHIFEFYFDGASTVTFWADGTAHATVATTSAATFPSAEEMTITLAIKTGQGTAKSMAIDWIRVVQFN